MKHKDKKRYVLTLFNQNSSFCKKKKQILVNIITNNSFYLFYQKSIHKLLSLINLQKNNRITFFNNV